VVVSVFYSVIKQERRYGGEEMKNSAVMTIAMVTMLLSLFFIVGCANQSKPLGMDWYSEVPKAEHDRRFPHGHKQIPGPKGENCVYNEATNTYFCQFHYDE
jgi:hypothetical protein